MTTRVIISVFIFMVGFNLILSIDDTNLDYQNDKDVRVVGRAYSLTGCDYGNQAGYTCVSCHRALHCYFGGAAIIVDCYGLFRYCRDGRCSRKQGAKCFEDEDTKLTTVPTALLNATNVEDNIIHRLPLSETNDVPNLVNAGIEASSSNNPK